MRVLPHKQLTGMDRTALTVKKKELGSLTSEFSFGSLGGFTKYSTKLQRFNGTTDTQGHVQAWEREGKHAAHRPEKVRKHRTALVNFPVTSPPTTHRSTFTYAASQAKPRAGKNGWMGTQRSGRTLIKIRIESFKLHRNGSQSSTT